MAKIRNITTNYLHDPLGIDCDDAPIFSWQFEQFFGLKQRSYRILVSDIKTEIERGVGNYWDSGIVESDLSCGIEYEGKRLIGGTVYYVRLFTETTQGTAECDGTFETALRQEDWTGLHWVVCSLNAENSSALVHANLNLKTKKISKARAYVAVLGLFEFYVNGEKANDVFMDPIITDTSKRLKYCVYDITARLVPGVNAIGVFLSQGWTDFKRLRFIVDVTYEDGEYERITSNEAKVWDVAGPVTHSSIYAGEVFDANIAQKFENWSTKNFAIGNRPCFADWGVSQRVEDTLALIMQPQQLAGMKLQEIILPCGKKVFSETRAVYRFDKHFSGWVRIRVKGKQGAKVTIRYAEVADENGEINTDNLRMAKCRDIYILRGGEAEEYAPRFTYRGFCFAEISTEGEVKVLSVQGEYIKTAVGQIGTFRCSNAILNRLHENILYTEGGNQNSTLTDCNQRNERFGWLNDLCSRIYQVVNNFDMSVFLEKILEDITDTMDENGAIADTAPNFFVGSRPAEPAAVCYLLAARFLYERYGNMRAAVKYFPYFKRVVDFYYGMTEDGILYFTRYGDWVPPYVNNEKDARRNIYSQTGAFSTAIMYWYLVEIVKLAEIVGDGKARAEYADKAEFVRRKFHEKYYNESSGAYGSGTQTENAFPLALGMAPENKRKRLFDAVVSDVVRLGYHSSCGNLAYRPLFTALMEGGANEILEKILVNEEYPGWGYTVAQGAISVWERWEKDIRHLVMQSLSHPMFGSYDLWFYEGLGGIRVKEGCCGMREFVLEPCFNADVDYVECSLETANGRISSAWRREEKRIEWKFTVPPNTKADIKLNDRPIRLPDGITESEGVLHCCSGDFCLEIPQGKSIGGEL